MIGAVLRDMLWYVGLVVAVTALAAGTGYALVWVAQRGAHRRPGHSYIAPPIPPEEHAEQRQRLLDALSNGNPGGPLVTAEGAAYLRALHSLPARLPAHDFPPVIPGHLRGFRESEEA